MRIAIFLLLGGILCQQTYAQSKSLSVHNIECEETIVPTQDRSRWPKGNWTPIAYQEYLAFKKEQSSTKLKPSGLWIDHAKYEAVFQNADLIQGSFVKTIKNLEEKPALLKLEPFNLDLSTLTWDAHKKPAVWGTTAQGTTNVFVEQTDQRLKGQWSLKGQQIDRLIKFDLQVPPATVSEFLLKLPANYLLKSSLGTVSVVPVPGNEAWLQWKINLGSNHTLRLLLIDQQNSQQRKPLVLSESHTSYSISEEGILIQKKFDIEVLSAPVHQLSFVLPNRMKIYSVVYQTSDDNSTLSWRAVPYRSMTQRKILVDFPKPLPIGNHQIRIQGFLATRLQTKFSLPKISLLNTQFLKASIQFKVDQPLELQFLATKNCEQKSISSSPIKGDVYSFDQSSADGELTVQIGYPPLNLSAQILSYLLVNLESYDLHSEIHFKTKSGSTFEASCDFSTDWEVIDVRLKGVEQKKLPLAWETARVSKNRQRLQLKFLKALNVNQPQIVMIVARRIPNSAVSLPLIMPQNCQSSQHILAVSHPRSYLPTLRAQSAFHRLDEEDEFPKFLDQSPLWKRILSKRSQRLFTFFSHSNFPRGVLHFNNQGAFLRAKAQVVAELNADQALEKFKIECTSITLPIKSLFLYLNQKGSPPDWKFETESDQSLKIQKVSKSTHPEWNLPPQGELWEIMFNQPLKEEFVLIGQRKRMIIEGDYTPTFLFVPGLKDFYATAEIEIKQHRNFLIKTHNLRANETSFEPPNLQDFQEISQQNLSVNYNKLNSFIQFRFTENVITPKPHQVSSLKLKTRFSFNQKDYIISSAVYQLEKNSHFDRFQFNLAGHSKLIQVKLNGKAIVPLEKDGFLIPFLNSDQKNVIEIQYQSPSSEVFLSRSLPVKIPQTSYSILSFHWDFFLPSHIKLDEQPYSIPLVQSLEKLTWNQRLFGVFGRSDQFSLFNPFRENQEVDYQSLQETHFLNEYDFVQAGNFFQLHVPYLPQNLSLKISNHRMIHLISWITFLVSLFIGFWLRVSQVVYREKMTVAWLSMLFLVILFAPDLYAKIAGSCLVGTFIMILIPSKFLIRQPEVADSSEDDLSLGSTRSLSKLSLQSLLFMGYLCFNVVPCQANQSPEDSFTEEKTIPSQALKVLIPRKSQTEVDQQPSFVYGNQALINQLKKRSQTLDESATYLITSAEYQAKVDAKQFVTLETHYQVCVLDPDRLPKVILPIQNAYLKPEGCLINGKSFPAIFDPQQKGFLINLAQFEEASSQSQVDSKQNQISKQNRQVQNTKIYQIQLQLHPAPSVEKVMGGGQFQIQIPAVSRSQLFVEFDQAYAEIQVSGDLGKIPFLIANSKRKLSASLGKNSTIQVIWSTQTAHNTEKSINSIKPKSVYCLTEIHSTWLEFHYSVTYESSPQSPIEFLNWRLPRDVIIREIVSESPLNISRVSSSDQESQLMIELMNQRAKQVVINAIFRTPLKSKTLEGFSLPVFDFFQTKDKQTSLFKSVPYYVALSNKSSFQIVPSKIKIPSLKKVSEEQFLEQFLKRWKSHESLKKPLAAYQIFVPKQIFVQATPIKPLRKTRNIFKGRFRKQMLDWILTAEVDTSKAAVFQHEFLVDPRLQIESISVQEGGAERLIRWSRIDHVLHLFLGEQTKETQLIVVKGKMALHHQNKMQLPYLKLKDSEIEESILLLSQNVDLNVEFAHPDSVIQVDRDSTPYTQGEAQLFLGEFQLKSNDQMPEMKIEYRNRTNQVDVLTLLESDQESQEQVWKVSTTFRLKQLKSLRPVIGLRIPTELKDHFQIESVDCETKVLEKIDKGFIEVFLRPKEVIHEPLLITVVSSYHPSPEELFCEIPVVSIIDAVERENILGIGSKHFTKPVGSTAVPLSIDLLPNWISETLSEKNSVQIFGSKSRPWKVHHHHGKIQQDFEISLVNTELWINQEELDFGRTTFLGRFQRAHDLLINWPTQLQLQGLIVNGTTSSTHSFSQEQLLISGEELDDVFCVTIYWKSRIKQKKSILSSSNLEFPFPQNVSVQRSLLKVVAPENCLFVNRNKRFLKTNDIDHHFELLRGLISIHQDLNLDSESTSQRMMGSLIDTLSQELKRKLTLMQNFSQHSDEENLQLYLQQYDELKPIFEQMTKESTDKQVSDSSSDWVWLNQTEFVEESVLTTQQPQTFFFSLPTDTPQDFQLKYWLIGKSLFRWSGIFVCLYVLWFLFHKLRQVKVVSWLQNHYELLFISLGVVWWICLSNSLWGMIFLLISVIFFGKAFITRWSQQRELRRLQDL